MAGQSLFRRGLYRYVGSLLLSALACGGTIGPPTPSALPPDQSVSQTDDPNAPKVDRDPQAPMSDPVPLGDAFSLPQEQFVLLPFSVRLAKVAAVAGLPPEDALFDELRANRLDLGDHDFAHGVRPDRSWSS